MKEGLVHASLIYGLFGGLMGSICMGWICSPKPPECQHACLAVVDLQALVSARSQQVVKNPVSSIRAVGDRLQEDLKTFAAMHNLILLARSAVIGEELPDKTEEILDWLDQASGARHQGSGEQP